MYYIAGLLNTDGYFRKDTDGFNLQLVGDSEYKLLEKIREYLELTCPIYKMGNRSILSVNYTGVNEHFKRAFNIDVKNKTFNTSVPKSFPNEECARAYVRGCLDGDGYIGSNKPRFTLLTASEKLVYGIKDIIKCYTKVDISVRYERRKTRNYPCIAVQGRNAIEVLDWVYGGNNFLTLERKYSRYKEYKLKR